MKHSGLQKNSFFQGKVFLTLFFLMIATIKARGVDMMRVSAVISSVVGIPFKTLKNVSNKNV